MAKDIVIVGGGSAGWMTAAYLSKALDRMDSIRVVESPRVKSIGVGEATFSTVKLFFDFLELDERDWMPPTNASYKMGIRFVGWRRDGGHFYHPFQRYEVVDGYNLGEWWLRLQDGRRGGEEAAHPEPFDYACFTVPALCDHLRSPRHLDGRVFDERVQGFYSEAGGPANKVLVEHRVQYPYAYHFDAGLLADFLRGYAVRRGVEHLADEVLDVQLGADGSIDHLVTAEHGAIRADLFVDCTGFRGLLVNQALGEPFISFGDSLLCDRAVALQVPVDASVRGIEPFTTATALGAGWAWNIPLYNRLGTGYVYSSAHASPAEAEATLRRQVGPAAEGCAANHVKMRIGRCRNSWVKNCVAIGLASGFVEPLESTGIFFIQHGIEELVRHLPNGNPDEQVVRSYNRIVGDCIDGVRDFLVLHYVASDRDDTEFWRATKRVIRMPDSLADRFALWQRRLPDPKSINPYFHGFESYSYSVMLLGLSARKAASLPVLEHVDERRALAAFRAVRERTARLLATLPSCYEYLTHLRSESSAAAGRRRSRRRAASEGTAVALERAGGERGAGGGEGGQQPQA
jgi:tryptophan halogenase